VSQPTHTPYSDENKFAKIGKKAKAKYLKFCPSLATFFIFVKGVKNGKILKANFL
jgi:hypothetical protein